MLSIVVNDALSGVDVMKKYPAFFARMLVDEELRTAFLDTLELLEQSRAGELPDYTGPEIINLDFLQQLAPRPVVRKSTADKLQLVWRRTIDQLQKMFYIASLQPDEAYRSDDLMLLDESHVNLLSSQVTVGDLEYEVRLDVVRAAADPGNLNLMIAILTEDDQPHHFVATVAWGEYVQTAETNKYGFAKFPPIKTALVFTPSGELTHDLELCLEVPGI
jgi:hypothetical protein